MPDIAPNRQTNQDYFELLVRFYQSKNGSQADATTRLRAQALVKDILKSRLDVDADLNAPEYVQTQGFADLGKALAASRALQVAFEGFRSSIPSGRANISLILDSGSPEEGGSHASPSVEQKDLLNSAKPSQVLITTAFYDRIPHFQLALRSYPGRAGVYEFLWTSEERLSELQAEVELAPTLIQPIQTPETVIIQPVKAPPVSRWKELEPAAAPPPQPVYKEPLPAEDPPPARRLSMAGVFAIGGVVALLVAGGYFITSHSPGNLTPPAAQNTQRVQPTISSPPAPAPAPQTSPPLNPPAVDTHQKKLPLPAQKPEKSSPTVSDKGGSTQPLAEPPAKTRGCSIDGDIPYVLELAERYRSTGKYERAIANYNLVLSCQPGNREALDGLHRAQEAEKYSSQ
ncbi:MAG TPA: hypothetical protein VMB49_18485 [Acidobacteriaceae bacterium]|nr:hypothetical protein [Acidobacteriaceae bacterium]